MPRAWQGLTVFSSLQKLIPRPHCQHRTPHLPKAPRRRRGRSQRRAWRRRPAAHGAGQVTTPAAVSGSIGWPQAQLSGSPGAERSGGSHGTGLACWLERLVATHWAQACPKSSLPVGPVVSLEASTELCRCSELNPRPGVAGLSGFLGREGGAGDEAGRDIPGGRNSVGSGGGRVPSAWARDLELYRCSGLCRLARPHPAPRWLRAPRRREVAANCLVRDHRECL